jgi:hypothetical protein
LFDKIGERKPDEAARVSYRFDNTTPEALSKAVAKEKQTIFL